MIRAMDIRDAGEARAVLELQKSSYAAEAEIIGSRELPPLWEALEELRSSGEDFYGYFLEGSLVGAISTKRRGNVLDIHRLFVGPDCFRRGIASSLLRFVERSGRWGRTRRFRGCSWFVSRRRGGEAENCRAMFEEAAHARSSPRNERGGLRRERGGIEADRLTSEAGWLTSLVR